MRFFSCLFLLFFFLPISCSNDKPQPLKNGEKAPLFSAMDMNGKQFSLADLQGRPVIIRFWSTECKFCRIDTPVFNRYYQKFKKDGLMIVYINTSESEQAVRDFIKDLQVVFPVIYDSKGELARLFNVKIQPMTIILSPEHKLISGILGGVSEAALQEILGDYLHFKPEQAGS